MTRRESQRCIVGGSPVISVAMDTSRPGTLLGRAFTAAPKSWKVMLVDDQDDEVDVTFARVLLMGDCSVLMCLWINCVRWCVGRGWRFVNRINKGRTQRSLKEGEKELLSKS